MTQEEGLCRSKKDSLPQRWRGESHVTKAQRAGKTSAGTLHPHAVACLGIEGKRTPGRRGRGEEKDAGPAWKKGRQRQAPPKDLPQHSHCLGRHLRITLVVPCVKYRLWSVAVTICYERTRTHTASDNTQVEDRPSKNQPQRASEAQGWREAGTRRELGRSRSTTCSERSSTETLLV